MSFYQINLAVFTASSAYLLHRQYRRGEARQSVESKHAPASADQEGLRLEELDQLDPAPVTDALQRVAAIFKRDFFLAYAFAVAADWLQGPHIYAIYKYEKAIPEKTVALLYAMGFVSGAASAGFAGELADRFGRRAACLVYCALYVITCLSMLSNNLVVLFFGRLCGGVSTTLLYSVFEAWMLTEYHLRGLDQDKGSALPLSFVFGYMTTLSCIVAIVSGVLGEMLVVHMGGRIWPFMASLVSCIIAAVVIWKTWRENYGTKSHTASTLADIRAGIATILGDAKLLALSISSCVFEGSMYLFIFFWSAELKAARAAATGTQGEEDLPFGLIFSSFMCAMMAGSALFALQTVQAQHTGESTVSVLLTVLLGASACFSAVVTFADERLVFWLMCVIEGLVGAYFPTMAFLKSELVDDGVRGRIYSILRFPLNLFVVVVHALDQEGSNHRNHVFTALAGLLLVAFFIVKRTF